MVEVKTKEGGSKGVFATEFIGRGSIVVRLNCSNISDVRTRTSIEVGDGLHVEHDIGKYINHSMHPNCVVLAYSVISSFDIKMGEEITTYYPQHESTISCPFKDTESGVHIDKGVVNSHHKQTVLPCEFTI